MVYVPTERNGQGNGPPVEAAVPLVPDFQLVKFNPSELWEIVHESAF
ncbi:MAG: hypothetical protein AAB899_01080 [Patescibacteria group bacterium]